MNVNYKIDLHTHSIISHDGGISKQQYIDILNSGMLDYIAITDHNETGFARMLNKEIGPKIIIGEEIKTTDGEIIGLFLKKTIAPGMSAVATINEIHADGGLIYVPHPFEKGRSSIQEEVIREFIEKIDIIETFNGRGTLRGKSDAASTLATTAKIAAAASSDAHCKIGIGLTYSFISETPTEKTLPDLLRKGTLEKVYAPWYSLLCPGINKIKNKLVL